MKLNFIFQQVILHRKIQIKKGYCINKVKKDLLLNPKKQTKMLIDEVPVTNYRTINIKCTVLENSCTIGNQIYS